MARSSANSKQVKLRLTHIDFWSAVRVGFVIQIALAIATIAGFLAIWLLLGATGLMNTIGGLVSSAGADGAAATSSLNLPTMMTFAVAISAFNIIVGTILAGVGAVVFNLIARITGGLLVGFANN
ncbi:MAG: DUF3566 domain-containing protein [Micrococcales bacterium]